MTSLLEVSRAQQAQNELEEASFAAWPCFEEEVCFGWRLRFAKGFTKRANSANAGVYAQMLTTSDLSEIEDQYRSRGLTSVFRLCSSLGTALSTAPSTASVTSLVTSLVTSPIPSINLVVSQVDSLLSDQGYRLMDRSIVMARPLRPRHSSASILRTQSSVLDLQAEQWLPAYYAVSGKASTHQDAHAKLLKLMPLTSIFAAIERDGKPVSCGIGVLSNGYLGLFEIATHSEYRSQGLATELCRHLLSWGHAQGAFTAYLQVEEVNHNAIRLYEDLGFTRQYEYWYRVAEE